MTTLHGTNGNDTIREDRYDGEEIYTYGGDDVVVLWVNDDYAGVRYVDTGDGNDWVEQSFNGHGEFNLGAGNDTFISQGDDTWLNEVNYVDGGAGNDSFIVDTHRSVYLGGAGNDSFRSTGWSNAFDGGVGRDFVSYDLAEAAMTINLAAGTAQRGGIRTEAIVNVEGARGTAFNDLIMGNNADNSLEGFSGNDQIDGGAGNDALHGDAGSDILIGGAGNDTLVGGAGNDTLNGGDGMDTADYSQSAGAVSVNLATGRGAGSDAQGDMLSAIERIIGSAFNDTLTGGTRNDTLEGGGGNDTLIGGAGNDTLNGGGGIDKAILGVSRAQAQVQLNAGSIVVTIGGEVDTLLNVERLQFNDKLVAFDTEGSAGQAYRLYQAAFARTPDTGGVSYWTNRIDKGANLTDVAAGFVSSQEFRSVYGQAPSNADIVAKFYQNVLNRAGETGGINFWVGELNNGARSVAGVLAGFSESGENKQLVGVRLANGIDLDAASFV